MMDKRDKRSSLDFLSDLPLSIIHSILGRVPIRDAVKTSILSRQWRYKWTTLPQLVFNDQCASKKTSLNHFVTQVLFLHKGPIHKFQLSSFKTCCSDQWLPFLSRSEIKILTLRASVSKAWFRIHSSIYSCQTLTHLVLSYCEIPSPPPTFNGFLCLRSLVLDYVNVPGKAVESIFANSPLLEEFTLDQHRGTLEFRIHAPNLKYFNVKGYYKRILLSAPLLSKYSVVYFNSFVEEPYSDYNYTDFLGGFPNLEQLSGGGSFLKFLSINVESYHRSLVFHRLRAIELSSVSFNIKELGVVLCLITGAPNLHKLKIARFEPRSASKDASISFWDSEGAPIFTCERLKEIELADYDGRILELKFVKFLLEISPVLETMIYKTDMHIKDRELVVLMAKLLRLRRTSANAEIQVFKG